jgi:hypothetical protein
MRINRRQFATLLAGPPLSMAFRQATPHAETRVNGVVFGVETFSFHDLPPAGDPRLIPTIISNLKTLGINECEIMSGHIEPFPSVSRSQA